MPGNKKLFISAVVAVLAMAGLVKVIAAVIFAPDSQPVGYVGQPAISSSNVASGNEKIFTIDYDANNWSGNVHSYRLSTAGAIGTVDDWEGGASAKIQAQSATNSRYIVTIKNGAGITFQWDQLSTGAGGQREALDSASEASGASGSPILDYIRGSSANEGTGSGKYRPRNYGLGDIIHSTPEYWNDGVNKTIFVGANDGMMHAINAADGTERFAYLPSVLMPRLAALTSPAYTHRYFVDGRLDVKKFDARTILVGTLGAGGKGVFGLDVTNATVTSETTAAAKVLWEVTNTSSGYADLGDTYGAPSLLTAPGGTAALAIGNGYNNTGSGHAVLYLVNAITGALIHSFDTGSGTTAAPNGLSSPSLWDADGDGAKDTAYAGDLDGNLWKFSLVAPYTVTSMYTNAGGGARAINMAPGLVAHPLGGVMVVFVTGRMLTAADASDTTEHYAYGIWDGAPAANDTLLEQTLTEVSYTLVTPPIRVRTATSLTPDWSPGAGHHKGWKTRLPINGERVVGDGAFVTGNVFQFFSTNPTIDPTLIPPGDNWWMQLNVFTGGDAGLTLFDLNSDNLFNSDDQVGAANRNPVGRNMGGGVRSQLIALSGDGMDVYQSNYDKNSMPVIVPTTTTSSTVVVGDRGVSGGHFDTDLFCYKYCGGGGNFSFVQANSGYYYKGDQSGGATDGLNYVHVHEYDDIYDRTGINLLHPSQDLQRLSGIKSATSTESSLPDTPQLKSNVPTANSSNKYPADATLVSTASTGQKSGNSVPRTTHSYQDGAITAVAGYPTSSTTASGITTTNKTRYTTTLTMVEAINQAKSGRKFIYNLRTTVRSWTTIRTTVEPSLRFKVLMANQAYSPAVKFNIEGAEDSSLTNATYNDSAFRFQVTNTLSAAFLPIYQLPSVNSLVLAMPLDAFNIKDWGTGTTRTGLHPIIPQCAGVAANGPTNGPLGEWRNGALTVQIVDPSVSDADIQMNVTSHPELGYRLRATSMKSKLIAEYLIYWHHPNGKCMATSGWTKTPPQDTSASDAHNGIWAPGERDPRGGIFAPGTGASSEQPVLTVGTVTSTVTNADGSTTTTTVVTAENVSGGYTVTTTVTLTPASAQSSSTGVVTGGAVGSNGRVDTGGINKSAANLGRITWREL